MLWALQVPEAIGVRRNRPTLSQPNGPSPATDGCSADELVARVCWPVSGGGDKRYQNGG